MGFDIKTALAGGAIPGLLDLFGKKESTFDPLKGFTPEQRKSVEALQSLASTGTGGGITLGKEFSGKLGEFTQTSGEVEALRGLQGLISGDALTKAQETFTSLADTSFDPSDPKSGFAAFSRALDKSGKESEDVLGREAAITGSRFGTGIQGRKADLASDLADQKGMFLASLFQSGKQQQVAGAQGLTGLAGTKANLLNQFSNMSAIERLLKDQEAKSELNEFKRTRNEELRRIDLMQDVTQTPLAPITATAPSMFQQLAPSIFGAIGTAAGGPIGGAIGSSVANLFGGGNQTPTGANTRRFI